MANPLTNFTVTAQSRHPKNNRGYDSKTHACSDDSFFVRAEDSCRQQGNFEGTMHPTASGHLVYSRQCGRPSPATFSARGPSIPTTPHLPNDDGVIGAEA